MTDSQTKPPSASPVILVAEDTPELRTCVAEYLRFLGFEVVAAENAQDALAAIGSGIHVDLVFTDINMPGEMDGVGLAHWISANRPDLPVILTSGELRPDFDRTTSHRHFVRKPYELDILEHNIRKLIGTARMN